MPIFSNCYLIGVFLYFAASAYGYSTSLKDGGFQYRGTIWQSGWVPVKATQQNKQNVGGTYFSRYSQIANAGSNRRPHDENSIQHQQLSPYFHTLMAQQQRSTTPNYRSTQPRRTVNRYGGIGSYYGGNPAQMLANVHVNKQQCEPTRCYVGCRKGLLGGGRCTRAGCLCYAAYFNDDGSPISFQYPQDRIWYSLPYHVKQDIMLIWQGRANTAAPAPSRKKSIIATPVLATFTDKNDQSSFENDNSFDERDNSSDEKDSSFDEVTYSFNERDNSFHKSGESFEEMTDVDYSTNDYHDGSDLGKILEKGDETFYDAIVTDADSGNTESWFATSDDYEDDNEGGDYYDDDGDWHDEGTRDGDYDDFGSFDNYDDDDGFF